MSQRPRLLLHVCCAPDATVGFERLGNEYEITAFFYNPNIHPEAEYNLRAQEFERLCAQMGVPYVVGPYDAQRWFDLVRGLEDEPERGRRCDVCYRMRLERTAQEAAQRQFDGFAVVLTVSPHKSASKINEIGEEVAARYGVRYIPTDLKKRDGFRRSVELSRQFGLYRQDYCGCLFSRRQREEKRAKADTAPESGR
ncbi:MAG: epoxyqueuosine reductase QueH [candidate division KSB1 bacterium]|nr:epoxyqueuosine reductase QueH [candidate division KSB1 bacterium]